MRNETKVRAGRHAGRLSEVIIHAYAHVLPDRNRDAPSEIKTHRESISLLIFHKLCCFCFLPLLVVLWNVIRFIHIGRYDAKRQEIEAWLMRMESRSERMGNAAAQADVLDFSVLDSQQKEQKVG